MANLGPSETVESSLIDRVHLGLSKVLRLWINPRGGVSSAMPAPRQKSWLGMISCGLLVRCDKPKVVKVSM